MLDLTKRWRFKNGQYHQREFFPSTAQYTDERGLRVLGYVTAHRRNRGPFIPCGAYENRLEEIEEDT